MATVQQPPSRDLASKLRVEVRQSDDARASPPDRSRRASALICRSIADCRSLAVERSARRASRMGRVSSLSAICACIQTARSRGCSV